MSSEIQSELEKNSPSQSVVATTEPPTTPAPEIIYSEEQQEFFNAVLERKENVLLLGKAGVGKSTATRELIKLAGEAGKSFAICAPTGKAAINIGGETLHKLIGHIEWWQNKWFADFILIDEVSMVRADLLDRLDTALKTKMMNPAPFGGVQIVLVGDPGQLPPVVDEKDDEHKYLQEHYLTHHFFGAASFMKINWTVQELTKIFRQKEERFPKLLNLVREGKKEKPIAFLNKFRTTTEPKGVILTGRNDDADIINKQGLSKLPGAPVVYWASITGELDKREWPADKCLELKVGARVMVIKNIYDGPGGNLILFNGDTGTVLDCSLSGEKEVTVRIDRTQEEHVLTNWHGIWEKKESKYNPDSKRLEYKVKGGFQQIPLRLAWAVTIHKAQGATIEEVTIDFRKPMFCAGQSYVALSRGISLDKVWIMGKIRPRDIFTDETVMDFLEHKLGSKFVGVKAGSQFDIKEIPDAEKAVAAEAALDELCEDDGITSRELFREELK